MKILVTGTAGFIGFHLAKKLLERGDEVVGLDNINDYYDVNLKYGRLKVFNNGEMSRDFTYIDDIVDGVIKVIDKPAEQNKEWNAKDPEISSSSAPYKIYNIGNNAPLPLMSFIETIEEALGKKAEKNFMDMQDGDVVSTYADVSDLINDFGYKPDTSLEVGIERFVKWYREFYTDKNKI